MGGRLRLLGVAGIPFEAEMGWRLTGIWASHSGALERWDPPVIGRPHGHRCWLGAVEQHNAHADLAKVAAGWIELAGRRRGAHGGRSGARGGFWSALSGSRIGSG
jgi:hypothetical protein